MPFSGSGSFSPYTPGNPVVSGAVISATDHNNTIADIASGLSNTVTRDGQSPPTANLPMGNFKLTGLAAGTVAGDSVRYEQLPSFDAVTSINGSCISGFRNRIHNGNFSINQRTVSGSVVLAAGAYGHDRWKAGAGGCTYTFATSLNVTTITISAGTLQQVIEGKNLESGTFKLSFSGTATARVDAGAYGVSGASVSGTAVGGTNQTVEFGTGTVSKVQYEFGTVVTTFEQRPYGIELALCQRYLPAFNGVGSHGTGTAYLTTNATVHVGFKVSARVAVTGIYSPNTALFNLFDGATNTVVLAAGMSIVVGGTEGALLNCGTGATLTQWRPYMLYGNSPSSQVLFTGAEL